MRGLQFAPADTWCLGDGTPFSGNSATQDSWGGLFPPHPPTAVGALRVTLALTHGWSGRGRWNAEITAVLGDGPHDVGVLRIRGPFLLRDGQPLYRMPHHVLGTRTDSGTWTATALMSPGKSVVSDLGTRHLPEFPAGDRVPASARGVWTTLRGMHATLAGFLPGPEDIVEDEDLWDSEERIGIARNRVTRVVEEGALFGVRHVRPVNGIAIGVAFDGLPPTWSVPDGMTIPFGGEGRMAHVTEWAVGDIAPGAAVRESPVAIVLLTPARLDQAALAGEDPIPGLRGSRIVSAVISGMPRIGGWDSGNRAPLPLRTFIGEGSTLFIDRSGQDTITGEDSSTVRIGSDTHLGFGLGAVGVWPGKTDTQEER